jgi:adenylate cyclase
MESLAEGGGICISGKVYEEVKHKLGLEYEYQGEQEVKNIAEPVPAYRVLSFPGAAAHRVVKAKKAVGKTWRNVVVAIVAVLVVGAAVAVWHFYFRPPPMEVASVERMAFALPDKPSIAVLPFVNMSGDPEQEYFSDGLTEEIITALSKTPKMFVIARNSTFSYKGQQVKIQQVAEELGVRYVLEGSVRKSEDRVRVTAQLIDAITGRHLWAERYDKDLKDIFALQDQITLKILNALQVKLTEGEAFAATAKGTDNLEAYLKWLRAREYIGKRTKVGIAMGRKLAEEAIALDPNFPYPYLHVSASHILEAVIGWSESPKQSYKLAEEAARKALALADNLGAAHAFLGRIYLTKRKYEEAIAEGERAIVLDPNSDFVHGALAWTLHRAASQEEAIGLFKKAIRLNPHAPAFYFTGLGNCYTMIGRYEDAVSEHKKNLRKNPKRLSDHIALAATYSLMGREEDARAEAEEVLRLHPKFSVKHFVKQQMYKDRADADRLIAALRKAGLPKTPPLPLPDKPSIAVLPFVNMSDDPEQEYFSDGITEEIITALSKVPKLFVIARNSSFTYKGKSVWIPTVSRELGVRYVLEGSVRKAGDKVRITAQLVDAKTGHHLWAERYDRELKDIFALQDEITMKVLTELQVKLTAGEQVRMWSQGTDNPKAYLKLLEGGTHFRRMNKEGNVKARKMFEEAIALDPEYPQAYAMLGWTYWIDVVSQWSRSPLESISHAFELAQKSIALDDSSPPAHGLLSWIYLIKRQHEKAIMEAEKGVAFDPNSADAYGWLGNVLNYGGRPEEAILALERATRLNPIPPSWYLHLLGMAYREAGRYEEAITTCKKALERQPTNIYAHLVLTATYSILDRKEEARAQAAEILRIDPKFSLEYLAKIRPHIDTANTSRLIEALRKAGLK